MRISLKQKKLKVEYQKKRTDIIRKITDLDYLNPDSEKIIQKLGNELVELIDNYKKTIQ